MSSRAITPPFPVFNDADGTPLENGYIYVGVENLDPVTNPIAIYWDEALTIPAAQPVRTLNGYPSRAGSPGQFFSNIKYSILVTDKDGRIVLSSLSCTPFVDSNMASYTAPFAGAVARTLQEKNEEILSLDDFDGCDPTGTTYSDTAWAAAIATGKRFKLVPGSAYKLSAMVTHTGPVYIDGNGATIKSDGLCLKSINGSGSRISNINLLPITTHYTIKRDPSVWTAVAGDVTQSLEGYMPTPQDADIWASLSGGIQAQVLSGFTGYPGIWMTVDSATPATDIEITGITGYSTLILLEGCTDSRVMGCDIGGQNALGAIMFWNGVNVNAQGSSLGYTLARGINNEAIGNTVKYCSYSGIHFSGNDHFKICGNTAKDNGESGIKTNQYDGIQPAGVVNTLGIISENNVHFNYHDGIDASAGYGVITAEQYTGTIVSKNNVTLNRATGITTSQASHSVVASNVATQNGGTGIFVNSSSYSVITGNKAQGNSRFGATGINNQWGATQSFDILAEGDGIISVGNVIACEYLNGAASYIHAGTSGAAPTAGLEGLDFGNVVTGVSTAMYVDPTIPSVRNGLTFPQVIVESSNANTLDAYAEYRAASTACTGAVTTAVSWKLTRIGSIVTLQLPATLGTGAASPSIRYGVAIPAAYRPTETMEFYVALVKDNNVFLTSPGLVQVDTSGNIDVFKNISTPNFTAGQPAGLLATTVSWMI